MSGKDIDDMTWKIQVLDSLVTRFKLLNKNWQHDTTTAFIFK